MKKLFRLMLSCTAVLTLSSCGSLRLTGTYPAPNHFAETRNTFEVVWSRVIDYFAIEGVPITTVDKSSGLIVSSKMSFLNAYTREVNGEPLDPDAYVVIPTVRGEFGIILEPSSFIGGTWKMIGDWNIRVKEENGKTIVNVNLTNLACYYTTTKSNITSSRPIPIKSTGKFEKDLLDYLTRE